MEAECRKVREDLDAFVDRELENQRQAAIEEHFTGCRPCLQLYRLIVGVKDRLYRAVRRPKVPEQLRARVLEALDQEVATCEPRPRRTGWLSWRLAPAAALAVVVVMAVVLVGSPPVQSYNFAEIAVKASHRLANTETHPVMPGSEKYERMFRETELPNEPMPSLALLNYKPEGCCFGLAVKHPVAHYLYRGQQGEVVSVVKWKRVSPKDEVVGMRFTDGGRQYFTLKRESVRLLLWENGEVFWAVFGQEPMEKLLEVASVIRS